MNWQREFMKTKQMLMLTLLLLGLLLGREAQAFSNSTTGRWLSRDPIEEAGGLSLYAFVENDGLNLTDDFGESKGHHVFPQAVSEGMSKAVREFVDQDVNRIFNDLYKFHGAQKMADISAKEYNKILRTCA